MVSRFESGEGLGEGGGVGSSTGGSKFRLGPMSGSGITCCGSAVLKSQVSKYL